MFSKTDMAKFELVVGLFDVSSMETVGFNLIFQFADKESTATPDTITMKKNGKKLSAAFIPWERLLASRSKN